MSIRGTSAAQDGRYFAQEKKLLAKMSFPSCFEQRVDMNKVQREVINQWITERITQLLGFEDEIVVAMVINLLETKVDEKLDPKQLQMAVTGFLEKQAGTFIEELWQLLLSAQSNPTGIPSSILDKKKHEMQRIAQEKARFKEVLDAKKRENQTRDEDRQEPKQEKEIVTTDERQSPSRSGRGDNRRRSRSLQRRPRRRSKSPRRRRRSPSLRKKRHVSSPRKRKRSRSFPRGRSRRGRSRSPSVKRHRGRRNCSSPSRSPDRARERRSARSRRSPRRESSRRPRRSPSISSSESCHRAPSSSRSPSSACSDSESGSN